MMPVIKWWQHQCLISINNNFQMVSLFVNITKPEPALQFDTML